MKYWCVLLWIMVLPACGRVCGSSYWYTLGLGDEMQCSALSIPVPKETVTSFEKTFTGTCDPVLTDADITVTSENENARVVEKHCVDGVLTVKLGFKSTVGNETPIQITMQDTMMNTPKTFKFKFQRDCPEGYIGVPGTTLYATQPDFCVSKFEYQDGSSGPKTGVTRDEAVDFCKDLGELDGYALMTNLQWQTIARNIEATTENWGVSGGNNMINRGVVSGSVQGLPDDESLGAWNVSRRAHLLSNGEVVWDIGGNVMEFVKEVPTELDRYRSGDPLLADVFGDEPFCATCGNSLFPANSSNRRLYAPAVTTLNNNNGVGTFWSDEYDANFVILRGGDFALGGGIYKTDLRYDYTASGSRFGFRCVQN